MLFTSLQFFVFLAAVAILYFLLPRKLQIYWLLLASLYFYASFEGKFLFVLLCDTIIAYLCARAIAGSTCEKHRKYWVAVAGILIFGWLGFFKYFNFVNDSLRSVFIALGLSYFVPHISILLPIGISFYSFQLFGYVMDVYRHKCEAEKNIVTLSVFASFFPQTVAGPIGRASALLPQIHTPQVFSSENLVVGMQMVLWGLFKKVVIADRLAAYVNTMFHLPDTHSGASLLLAVYLFTFQIYYDFSGYSDIAIGSARILGFRLMKNFDYPYFASNITDFWKRWHISLSSWFGEYLYIPLGGNRVSHWKWVRNIMVVFLVSGLWHGANWTFIVWGALHGIFYFIARGWTILFPFIAIKKWLKVLITFHSVAFAWIFFRASSLHDACIIISRIFTQWGKFQWSGSLISVALMFPLLSLMVLIDSAFFWKSKKQSGGQSAMTWSKMLGYTFLAIMIALFGVSQKSFLYLQF